MASKKLTISCPEDLLDFLREHDSLSPSKVFQGAIENIMNSLKSNPQLMEANQQIEKLKKACDRFQEVIGKHAEFISKKDLWAEYDSQ